MNYDLILATVHLVAGGLILIFGLTLLRESPKSRLNRLVALVLFFAGLGTTLGSSDFLIPHVNPKLGQQGRDLLTEFSYLWEFFFPALLLFALSFPVQHPVLRRVPALKVVLFLPHAIHLLFLGAHAFLGESFGLPSDASVAWTLLRLFVGLLYSFHRILFSLVNLVYLAASLVILRITLRSTVRAQLRDQLATIGWGMSLGTVLYAVSALAGGVSVTVRHTLLLLALAAACGSIAFAMVRYRFLDASLIVRRAILYATSTAVVVGIYLTLVLKVDQLIRRMTGVETPIFQGLGIVIALILYQPILSKLEELLERFLLKDPTDHRTALRRLSEEIVTKLETAEVARMVVDSIGKCLMTDRVALVQMRLPGAAPVLLASHGIDPVDPTWLSRVPTAHEIAESEALARIAMDGDTFFFLPLRHQDELLGAIFLGEKLTGRGYTGEDRALLSAMANQVSMALKNAELYESAMRRMEMERDLETARRIQRSFLPSEFPKIPGLDVFGRNVPSRQVGGDYYDVLTQAGHALLLTVADVSGKGVAAALQASMLQASLRTQAPAEVSVGVIMSRLNALVCQSTSEDQFASCFLARVDPAARRLVYANAGHNFPVLLRRSGEACFLQHSDLLLGVFPSVDYRETTLDLEPGDRLVLFTDGLTEAKLRSCPDGVELLGDDGLFELLKRIDDPGTAADFVSALDQKLQETVVHDAESDDLTVLVLRVADETP